MQRLGVLAAAVFLVALVGSMAIVFYAVRHPHGGTASPPPTSTLTTARVPLKVMSVSMSVTPGSIANISCGTNLTVTYTALFHVVANSAGGTVHFNYTVNNGRGQTPASITFNPGETTKSYTFTSRGALPVDHTYPEPGGVQVTSPNQLTSPIFSPGQTIRTYSFAWSGCCLLIIRILEPGDILVTSPNQLTSLLVAPTGRCS